MIQIQYDEILIIKELMIIIRMIHQTRLKGYKSQNNSKQWFQFLDHCFNSWLYHHKSRKSPVQMVTIDILRSGRKRQKNGDNQKDSAICSGCSISSVKEFTSERASTRTGEITLPSEMGTQHFRVGDANKKVNIEWTFPQLFKCKFEML